MNTFNFIHTFISFQDLYRVLLEAESEVILDDVDMTQVEKLILDPKAELESVGRPRDVEEVEEKKRTKIKAKKEGILHNVDMTQAENLILGPQDEMKSVGHQRGADLVKQDKAIGDFELDKKWRLCGIYSVFLFLGIVLCVIYYLLYS